MANIDPNWLLSTTAQSAAALVAIVGGFLVSRVVGLQSTREGLLRQRRELSNQRAQVAAELQEVQTTRYQRDIEEFRDECLAVVVKRRGDVTPEELLSEFVPRVSTREQLQGAAEALIDEVKKAWTEIAQVWPDSQLNAPNLSWLRSQGVEIPKSSEAVYEAVAYQVEELRRKNLASPFASVASSFPHITPQIEQHRDLALESESQMLQSRIQALDAQLDLVHAELLRIGRPRGVGMGIGVLSYLAVGSVILPIVMLASRPVPDSLLARRLIVVLFASGLVALLGYLIRAIRSLGRPDEE